MASYSTLRRPPAQRWLPSDDNMPSSFYNTPASTRDHFAEPPAILARVMAELPSWLAVRVQRLWERHRNPSLAVTRAKLLRSLRHAQRTWTLRRLLSLPHLFVALWVVLLLWGERWVFERSIAECKWDSWEKWVSRLATVSVCSNAHLL